MPHFYLNKNAPESESLVFQLLNFNSDFTSPNHREITGTYQQVSMFAFFRVARVDVKRNHDFFSEPGVDARVTNEYKFMDEILGFLLIFQYSPLSFPYRYSC